MRHQRAVADADHLLNHDHCTLTHEYFERPAVAEGLLSQVQVLVYVYYAILISQAIELVPGS